MYDYSMEDVMKLTGEINQLTNDELFTAYAATCNFNSEDLHSEINRRVRRELKKQLEEQNVSDDESRAILNGFDESATWHFDAARTGDFAKSIPDAVSDYLADERDVYAMQHAEGN